MARMIPAALPEGVESESEKNLFPLLRDDLDEAFTVFYSFDLLTRNREGALRDGEVDFLIFHPELGLLSLEVKGGRIRYDGGTRAWFQNEHRLNKSPYAQAKDGKFQVEHFLQEKLGALPDIPLAHAVYFPDMQQPPTNLPQDAAECVTLTGRDLPYLQDAIANTMKRFRKKSQIRLDRAGALRVMKTLTPQFECGSTLSDRMADAEQRIFLLTEEQCAVMDLIHEHRTALIHGCAGSGKTLMAVKKARELADGGKKVLLLAYNRLIATDLIAATKDCPLVTASTYHAFCVDRLTQAGCMPEVKPSQAFWETDIPARFAELQAASPIKFDAVIVDEGQDFKIDYWITIQDLVGPDSWFYVFYDENQNVYGSTMAFPIDREPLTINTNCRNTRTIFDAVAPYAKKEMRLKAGAPDGEPVQEHREANPTHRRKQLSKCLYELIHEKGMDIARVVILGGHGINSTCIGESHSVGEFRISDDDTTPDGHVAYHTYMKFKGCEADAIILLDVDDSDLRWADQVPLYTAISRARHILYIIYS